MWCQLCSWETQIYATYKRLTSLFFFFFYFSFKDTQRLKVKEWKNIFHAYVKQKKVGIVKLVLDKIDFKIKDIVRDKKGHYIMKRGSIQQENITLVTQEHQNI